MSIWRRKAQHLPERPGAFGTTAILSVSLIGLVACGSGGGDSFDCDPSPRITSTPPLVAYAGSQYRYSVDAQYVCIPVICNSVDGVHLPVGAAIDDYYDLVTWTPTTDDLNRDVNFEIATERDSCGDRAKQSWTVHVYAPIIESFSVDRSVISEGQSSTLTAVFNGTGRIEGLGPVSSGVPVDTPPLDITTTFTLTVTGVSGTVVNQTLTVEVLKPPQILSFSANPAVITVGGSSTLRWSTSGDFSEARLEPLGVDVIGRRTYDVMPATTTSYELHLSNDTGATASGSIQIVVVPPPVIDSFSATPSGTVLQGSVTLTAEFRNGSGELWKDCTGNSSLSGGVGCSFLAPVLSGVGIDSGELLRSTRYQLVVSNAAGAKVTQTLFVPITGPGTFQPTKGQPLYPLRGHHTATRLNDGRVFIAGGRVGWEYVLTTELYDPVTDSFSAGPDMPKEETWSDRAAALLPDGRVLLVGGYISDSTQPYNAEIFDPGSNTITWAGTLPVTRFVLPHAKELIDGRVLVVHGGTNVFTSAEVFDPLTEMFTAVGPFNVSHGCTRIERLDNGKVLVIDGYPDVPSELFDPATDSFTLTDAVTHRRCYFESAKLQDGRVLVSGYGAAAEIYDPSSGMYEEAGMPLYAETDGATASTLVSGAVLVVGGLVEGRDSPWAQQFDPATGSYSATGGLRDGHRFHTTTVLQDGRVLVVGGCGQLPCDAEVYTPP